MSVKKKAVTRRYVLSFLAKFSAIILTGFGAFGLLIVTLTNKRIGPTYSEGVSALSQIQAYLPLTISVTALAQALTLCAIAMLVTLIWSHSVAGPLVRFRNHLRHIAQGKIMTEPISFRDTDQLHGLALAFSEMVIINRDTSTKALEALTEAQRLIIECEALEKHEKPGSQELDKKIKELKRIYNHIKNIYGADKLR